MSRKQHSKSPEGGKGTKSIRGPVSRSGRLELSRKWGGVREKLGTEEGKRKATSCSG